MSPETIAIAKCEGTGCGREVAVKLNRSGLAYYRCDHCGREVKHHWQRKSDAYVTALGATGPATAPAAAKPPAKKPEITKAEPAPTPVKAAKNSFFD